MTLAIASDELVRDDDLDDAPSGDCFGSHMGRLVLAEQEQREIDEAIEESRSEGATSDGRAVDGFDLLYDAGLLPHQQPGYAGWGAPESNGNGNGHKPESVGQVLDSLGVKLKLFREKLPADSPLAPSAFRLAALLGELQARIGSK